MPEQYDAFAEDYDWLFSDTMLSGEPQYESLRHVLDSLPPRGNILDCACGTGILALALSRYGHKVVGTDASEGMIRAARARAEAHGLGVPFHVCPWERLPKECDRKFDLALCCGNSIGHCRDSAEMVRSLRGIHSVLNVGGRLVLDTRNWAKLLAERTRYTHFGPRSRDGKRCVPIYIWNFPKRTNEPIQVEVLLPIEHEGKVDLHVHPIVCHPFTLQQLQTCLAEAGFSVMENDYSPDRGEYRVIASDPPGTRRWARPDASA
jgi:SAM-dependent methyltransferase